jgi:hypothetical protein
MTPKLRRSAVTRAVTAALTLLAAVAIILMLRFW